MTRGDDLRLADIADACRELAVVAASDRDSFLADAIRVRAAERILEIIGEAASALSDQAVAAYPGVNWRDITRLRIVLAHHYQRVDPRQVWVIATVHVPELARQLSPKGPRG